MCGIFGVIVKKDSPYNEKQINKLLIDIASLSESRGNDSSGIVIRNESEKKISVIKGALPISKLLLNRTFKENFEIPSNFNFVAMGHARLTTNGTQLKDENNQPVIKDGIVGIHNGIIVNVDDLWDKYPELDHQYDIDTEILLSLLRMELNSGHSIQSAISLTNKQIFGTVSTALLFNDRDDLALFTNNGSLYYLTNNENILVFASENYYLEILKKKNHIISNLDSFHLESNCGITLNIKKFHLKNISLLDFTSISKDSYEQNKYSIEELIVERSKNQISSIVDIKQFRLKTDFKKDCSILEYNWNRIKHLKRCTKCLLPETFPMIEYDNTGKCNYCKNYSIKSNLKPISKLMDLVEPYRSKNGAPDCIVPFSGGRDSTYTLHIVKNILKLNPITFTYDWGMVTDLARRNIARACGKLGVENIIISANIQWKRDNIRKNVLAWLKNPDLGMVPLFMAGDKYFFYYTNKVLKQTGVKLNLWGINPLENTDFKTGFAGIRPNFSKKRIYSLSMLNQLKLFGFVANNIMQNPAYINKSIFDTFGAFVSRYIIPKHNYYHLFDYYRWDESEIENLLINEYKWETAIDTKSTWRIGDGTASFYNYIFFTVAGFSEIETFRSNQIREGMLTRNEGLKLIEEENLPRYDSLRWYLEVIGLDYTNVIKTINAIPKLY